MFLICLNGRNQKKKEREYNTWAKLEQVLSFSEHFLHLVHVVEKT